MNEPANTNGEATGRVLRFKPRGMLRLDDEQYERLRQVAYEEHTDMSEIIRQGLALRFKAHDYNAKRRAKSARATSSVEA